MLLKWPKNRVKIHVTYKTKYVSESGGLAEDVGKVSEQSGILNTISTKLQNLKPKTSKKTDKLVQSRRRRSAMLTSLSSISGTKMPGKLIVVHRILSVNQTQKRK